MKKQILSIILFLSAFFSSQKIVAQHQNALDFDGIDDEVIVGAASSLIAGSSAYSLSCWVYPTNTAPVFPDYDGFAGFRNDIDADFYLVEFGVNRLEARFRNSAGINFDIVDTAMPVNVWVHYTFTYSGSELTLYRNGTLYQSISANGSITSTIEDFHIGNMYYSGAAYLLTGKVDEVGLWSRALNPNEVNCIYNESINPTDIALQLYFDCNQGVANADNTLVPSLTDIAGHINGTMIYFALTGTTSNFVDGINNYSTVSDVICPGTTYTYSGQTLTAPGTYLFRFPITTVCDSVVSLVLTTIDTTITEVGGLLTATQSGGQYQWIDCVSQQPIAGENGQSFYPLVSGYYAVAISSNGCSDTSECHNVISNGIVTLQNLPISISQNPFSDQLKIDIGKIPVKLIRITNAIGQIIYVKENDIMNLTEVNTESWNSGIYFVNCYTHNSMKTLKVVKN